MRVYALLNWYDEPPSWLAACVASASKLCDGVIAVDGAYALFPGALRKPSSDPEQTEIIQRTAAALGMTCTIHVPSQAWWGGEVAKRQAMFDIGAQVTQEGDWYLILDADELLSDVPPDARKRLEASTHDVAECSMWEQEAHMTTEVGVHPMPTHKIRRLYRALAGMRCGPAHHVFSVEKAGEVFWLSDASKTHPLRPAEQMWDLRIEHRGIFRTINRRTMKRTYYTRRDELGIEEVTA